MASNDKHSSFEYINLDGKNNGATMKLHQRNTKGESKDCCCINIYINNNVQAVSNSVLHGSHVEMRDPGVRLYFHDLRLDREIPSTNKWVCWEILLTLRFWLYLFLFFSLLFLLLSSNRILILII